LINYIYHFKFYLFSNKILIKIKVIKVNKFIKSNEELINNFPLSKLRKFKVVSPEESVKVFNRKDVEKSKKMYIYDSEAFS
jgi:hypothetical protein